MRVAVDINDLKRPQSGIGRYICGLLMGFRELAGADEFALLHKDGLAVSPPADSGEGPMKVVQVRSRSETWWGQVSFGRAAAEWGAGVLFCPAVRAPVAHRLPLVLTVHDVIFAVHPEFYDLLPREYMRWMTRLVLPRCQGIIAVSEATKRDLVERFGVAPERVEVIYHGIEARFHPRPRDQARSSLSRHGIEVPERFFLFVGTLEPRKNLTTLLRAFEQARKGGLAYRLVIAGRRGWRDQDLMSAVERGSRLGWVTYLGHVPDPALPDLYGAADGLAYPSRYEGFGFPVLEGMASGTPVITSSAPGVAEVAGDACLVVAPDDESGLVRALCAVAYDEPLRQRLTRAGLERAGRFSWRQCALSTRRVLMRAVGSARRAPVKSAR